MCQNSTDSQKPLSGACAKVQGHATAQLQLSNQSPTMCQFGMSLTAASVRIRDSNNTRSGAASAPDLLFGVAKSAEHPVVEPDPARLLEEMRADIFPDRLAFVRHLEKAAVAAFANERIAVREALGAGDIGAEEFEDRLTGIAPHDLAGFRIDLDHARERHRIVVPMR